MWTENKSNTLGVSTSCLHSILVALLFLSVYADILGDPGAVSGGGEKSKNGRKKIRPFLDFSPPPLTAPGSPRMFMLNALVQI